MILLDLEEGDGGINMKKIRINKSILFLVFFVFLQTYTNNKYNSNNELISNFDNISFHRMQFVNKNYHLIIGNLFEPNRKKTSYFFYVVPEAYSSEFGINIFEKEPINSLIFLKYPVSESVYAQSLKLVERLPQISIKDLESRINLKTVAFFSKDNNEVLQIVKKIYSFKYCFKIDESISLHQPNCFLGYNSFNSELKCKLTYSPENLLIKLYTDLYLKITSLKKLKKSDLLKGSKRVKKISDISNLYKEIKLKYNQGKYIGFKDIIINKVDYFGWTLLLSAISDSNIELSKKLIESGADINIQSNSGLSPIMCSIMDENYSLVNLLLNNGADVNSYDKRGWTPLMYAIESENGEIIKLILEHSNCRKLSQYNGWTPLMLAIDYNNDYVVKSLLLSGININYRDKSGLTALIVSSIKNNIVFVNLLLDKNADPNLQDNQGWSALTYAARYGYTEIAKILIDNGAKIDEGDNFGYTPLMIATWNGHLETVKLLCKAGADKSLQVQKGDYKGYTALKFAKESGYSEIVKVLKGF